MKVFWKLAFFAFVSLFVLGIPAGIHWLTNGTWPKDFWLEVLIFLATCAVISIHEQLQTIFSATQGIEKRLEGIENLIGEVMENFKQLEDTLSEIDDRIPKPAKSYLDRY